jgi:hypothetical protein
MTAFTQALSRWSWIEIENNVLTAVALSCGAGLLVCLMFASYGLDLSPGFF